MPRNILAKEAQTDQKIINPIYHLVKNHDQIIPASYQIDYSLVFAGKKRHRVRISS